MAIKNPLSFTVGKRTRVGFNVKVKDIDRGWVKFLRSINTKVDVTVGIQGPEADATHDTKQPANPDTTSSGSTSAPPTNVDIATAHEFGVPGRLPERSFLRATFIHKQKRLMRVAEAAGGKLLTGQIGTRQVGNIMGGFAVSEVKSYINRGDALPLVSQATADNRVSGRKSLNALIDTSQMRDAITFVVDTLGVKRTAGPGFIGPAPFIGPVLPGGFGR